MKILLDVKGIGILAIIPHNYVIADGIGIDKRNGSKFLIRERFFPTLSSALEELRQVNQAKGLAKGSPAKNIAELMNRVERISKVWFSFIKKAELKGLKEVLPPPTK